MNKHEFRKSDLIAIVGILMFAIVYAVDKLVYEMPKTTFIVLVAIAMVLLIVGAIVSRKTTADIHRRTAPGRGTAGAVFYSRKVLFRVTDRAQPRRQSRRSGQQSAGPIRKDGAGCARFPEPCRNPGIDQKFCRTIFCPKRF